MELLQISNNLIGSISLLTIYSVAKNKIVPYILVKDSKIKNIPKYAPKPKLKWESKSLDDLNLEKNSEKVNENIKAFIEMMHKNFHKNDLINFYNNLNKATFRIDEFINLSHQAGYYHNRKNEVVILDENSESTIYHELFHLASTKYTKKIGYSGFSQALMTGELNKVSGGKIGDGLNEGYTELLTERYSNGDYKSYFDLTNIALCTEKTVGQDKMQSLYLNANLEGLIDELKQYSTEEEVMKFIYATDFIEGNFNEKRIMVYQQQIQDNLKNIYKFLLKVYVTKKRIECSSEKITNHQLENDVMEFIESLPSGIRYGDIRFEYLTGDDCVEILKEVLEGPNSKITVTFSK